MKLQDGREVLGVVWKTGRTNIGVVAVKLDPTDEWAAYITTVQGYDEKSDIHQVAEWGTRLTLEEAMGFFPNLKMDPKKYKQK